MSANVIPPKFDLSQLIQPEEFIRAAETQDELGSVLRMHLCLEQLLDKFIEEMATHASGKPSPRNLTFSNKIKLSRSSGLAEPIAEAIALVNKIRNKFAHERGAVLSQEDIGKISDCVDMISILPWKKEPPVRNMWIQLCVARSGEKLGFGKHGTRIDFVIACGELLRRTSGWMVMEYVRRHPELTTTPDRR